MQYAQYGESKVADGFFCRFEVDLDQPQEYVLPLVGYVG